MMDATVYPSADLTPELAVRQIFVKTRVSEALQLIAAKKGLLDADSWAAIADNLEKFREHIVRLIPPDELGDAEDAREASLITLPATWRKCRALADGRDTRRARLEEEPFRIPGMGVQEFGQKRANFVLSHPNVLLCDFYEPHKRGFGAVRPGLHHPRGHPALRNWGDAAQK